MFLPQTDWWCPHHCCSNPVYDIPAHMQHKWLSHTYFWQFIGNQMNFVLTMFFGGSGLLHILVTMKQHKSLVLTSQYTHAIGTVLRQFGMTKLLTWHTAASKSHSMQLVHTAIYLSFVTNRCNQGSAPFHLHRRDVI